MDENLTVARISRVISRYEVGGAGVSNRFDYGLDNGKILSPKMGEEFYSHELVVMIEDSSNSDNYILRKLGNEHDLTMMVHNTHHDYHYWRSGTYVDQVMLGEFYLTK